MKIKSRKIALVGCSNIDPVDTFYLAKSGWVNEMVLVGDACEHLADHTEALLATLSYREGCEVSVGDIYAAANAELAIINNGSKNVIGESRAEETKRTLANVKSDVKQLVQAGFRGVFLVIAEPVDLLAAAVLRSSGFEPSRVMGIGNGFSIPSERSVADRPKNIWCTGMHSNKMFFDHCDPNCAHFEFAAKPQTIEPTAAVFKNNRFGDIAICVSRVCQAVLNDEKELLPVSAWQNGEYGVSGIYMTVPCIVGREGIKRIVKIPTSLLERQKIQKYAAEQRSALAVCEFGAVRACAATL
jgi:L-lactate dehydrogenase